MPGTLQLTIDGKPVSVDWGGSAPPSEQDIEDIGNAWRQQHAVKSKPQAPSSSTSFLSSIPGLGPLPGIANQIASKAPFAGAQASASAPAPPLPSFLQTPPQQTFQQQIAQPKLKTGPTPPPLTLSQQLGIKQTAPTPSIAVKREQVAPQSPDQLPFDSTALATGLISGSDVRMKNGKTMPLVNALGQWKATGLPAPDPQKLLDDPNFYYSQYGKTLVGGAMGQRPTRSKLETDPAFKERMTELSIVGEGLEQAADFASYFIPFIGQARFDADTAEGLANRDPSALLNLLPVGLGKVAQKIGVGKMLGLLKNSPKNFEEALSKLDLTDPQMQAMRDAEKYANAKDVGVTFQPDRNLGKVTAGARAGALNSTGHITTADTMAADLQASIDQLKAKKGKSVETPQVSPSKPVVAPPEVSPTDPFAAIADDSQLKAPPETPTGKALLDQLKAQRAARIAKLPGQAPGEELLGSGQLIPQHILDKLNYTLEEVIGFAKAYGQIAGDNFKQWQSHMRSEFGKALDPHLKDIWNHTQEGYGAEDPFLGMPKGKIDSQKVADTALAYHRFNMLSGPGIAGKLGTSAIQTAVTTTPEDLLGWAIGKVAPKLGKAAPWEAAGAKGVVTQWQGFKDLFVKNKSFDKGSLADAWGLLKTGQNELSTKYGESFGSKEFNSDNHALGFFGRLHGAVMTPLQRGAYIRSLGNRMDALAKVGIPPSEYSLTMAAKGAYGDSLQAIFRNNNKMTDAFSSVMKTIEMHTGKPTATWLKNIIPFAGVGTNVAGRMAEYSGAGALWQGAKVVLRGGLERMTPEEAATVLRAYKRAGIGGGLFAIGYLAPDAINKLPNAVKHNPAVQVAVIGAIAAKNKGWDDVAARMTADVANNIPFISSPQDAMTVLSPSPTVGASERGKALGYELSSWFPLSGLVGYTARTMDKKNGPSLTGDTTARSPKGFRDELKMGIPVVRQQVRKK